MIKMLTKDGPVTKIRARFDTPMQDMVKPNTHEVGDHMITIHTVYGPIPKLRAREHFYISRMNLPGAVLDVLIDEFNMGL
jgi:hypothetical protein